MLPAVIIIAEIRFARGVAKERGKVVRVRGRGTENGMGRSEVLMWLFGKHGAFWTG